MKTTAWWHCFSGIAGDMALASLLDAGADVEWVRSELAALPLPGWSLETSKTRRAGLVATQVHVHLDEGAAPVQRDWATLRRLVADSLLPERVKTRAQTVFASLAVAEGALHGMAPEEVHFHEVGGVDAVVDIVGTCLALESLRVDAVFSSPVALGTGTTRSQHGLLPNPPPAVLRLLAGAPAYGTSQPIELTTPTGAALVAGLAEGFGPFPPTKIAASGYGAGAADLGEAPNVVQVVIGEALPWADEEPDWADLVQLETNVDDVTGEILAHTVSALVGAGARDAWLVPTIGKKGRPGYVLSALTEPWRATAIAKVMMTETGSLGIRSQLARRWAAPRRMTEVDIDGIGVRVKVGPHRVKAEHDDCAKAATALGLRVPEVARRAEDLAMLAEPALLRDNPAPTQDGSVAD